MDSSDTLLERARGIEPLSSKVWKTRCIPYACLHGYPAYSYAGTIFQCRLYSHKTVEPIFQWESEQMPLLPCSG